MLRNGIIINSKIDVLVCSCGGVGTTFLIREIAKYQRVNDPTDLDGHKHIPIPPLSRNRKLKVVYVYGDPILSCMSLFRRNFHHAQSLKMHRFFPSKSIVPTSQTIENYALIGQDGFGFDEHFENYYSKFIHHPTLFIRYDAVHAHLDSLANFLELPPKFLTEFPPKKDRVSTYESMDTQCIEGLEKIYAGYLVKVKIRPEIEIKEGVDVKQQRRVLFTRIYVSLLFDYVLTEFRFFLANNAPWAYRWAQSFKHLFKSKAAKIF